MKLVNMKSRFKPRLSMIIYALTGVGKTEFCGTLNECEETSPTLVININGGPNTLAGKDIDVFTPKSLKHVQSLLIRIFEKNLVKGSKLQYKSICIDGITGFQQEISMPEIQNAKGSGDVEAYDFASSSPPDRRHWLHSHEQVRMLLRAARDLTDPDFNRKIHVIMTALEKKDEERGILCPALPGKLGQDCGAYVDVLGRLTIEEKEKDGKEIEYRKLWVNRAKDEEGLLVLAKNRGGFIGKTMVNPTMDKIIKKWNEGGK